MIFSANRNGLHIDPGFLSRPFLPPLFIPWEDIRVEKARGRVFPYFWLIRVARLTVKRVPDLSILVSMDLMERILRHSAVEGAGPEIGPAERRILGPGGNQ